MIHALAKYHKSIKDFSETTKKEKNVCYGLKDKFNDMKKIIPKNKSDVLMLKNIENVIKIFDKIKGKKLESNILPIHLDFHKNNIVFNKDYVVGILDFENIVYAPRIRDIAHLIKTSADSKKTSFSQEVNFIIQEYHKVNPLTKKEKKDILIILARDSCIMFEYFYSSQKSKKSNAENPCLNWTISVLNDVMKVLNL
jgi:Ser/Thr protein kinase RdoA (MazF antagonist)